MRYELQRSEKRVARNIEHDAKNGKVYVYVRFDDRVDVYQFQEARLRDSDIGGEELLSVTEPRYRVSGSSCTCEGYKYRQKCRHTERVKRLSESELQGWRGAGE